MKLKRAVFLDLGSVHRGDLDLSILQAVVPECSWFDKVKSVFLD